MNKIWSILGIILLAILVGLLGILSSNEDRVESLAFEENQVHSLDFSSSAHLRWDMCAMKNLVQLEIFIDDVPHTGERLEAADCMVSTSSIVVTEGEHSFRSPSAGRLKIYSSTQGPSKPAFFLILFSAFAIFIATLRSEKKGSPPPEDANWRRTDALIALILLAFLLMAATILTKLSISTLESASLITASRFIWQEAAINRILISLIFLGIALFFSKLRFGSATRGLGLNPSTLPLPVSACIGVAIALIPILSTFILKPQENTDTLLFTLSGLLSLTSFFSLIAAVSEEFLFRGLIFGSFMRFFGKKQNPNPSLVLLVSLITTAIFLSLHLGQASPLNLIPIGLFSIASCLWRHYSKSIHGCVLMHLCYNATLSLLGFGAAILNFHS